MAKPRLIEGDVNGLGKLATACPKIKILMAKKKWRVLGFVPVHG